jgi:hypothetical protein
MFDRETQNRVTIRVKFPDVDLSAAERGLVEGPAAGG